MDFVLFILANMTVFLRPQDILPALADVPIYLCLIMLTLVAGFTNVLARLNTDRLSREPITVCVLGLIPAVFMSHAAHFDLWSARMSAFEFSKTVMYYIALVSVVNTKQRIRFFLYTLALLATVNSVIAILHFYEIINVPTLSVAKEGMVDSETGEMIIIDRLMATGIFNDPNDLAMISVFAAVICIYGMSDRRTGAIRFLWLVPLMLLLATIVLTKSRGGMLALLSAVGMLIYFRFGLWKAIVVMGLVFPPVLMLGGRQTDFDSAMSGGTGAGRMEIWSEGFMLFKRTPLFGIGYEKYAEEVEHVAHNSFVHCFVELGFFGGAFFLGTFWFAGLSLWKLGRGTQALAYERVTDPAFGRLARYYFVMLLGAIVSMISISRSYVITTYLVLGLADAFCLEAQRQGLPAVIPMTPRRFFSLVPVSFAYLVVTWLMIRISIR